MNWIKTKDKLPKEGEYVIGQHNVKEIIGNSKKNGVNCEIVTITKGISKIDRERMKNREIKGKSSYSVSFKGNTPLVTKIKRWDVSRASDEGGNNKVPYCWNARGYSFNGLQITHWAHIPLNKNV
mgnify:CR=1 FL=1